MHVIVTCTLRTMEEQAALYAQARQDMTAVNALRRIAGMPPISGQSQPDRHPCKAGVFHTQHNFGLAFDVVPLDTGNPYGTSPILSGRG
jgi:hypothetical protein